MCYKLGACDAYATLCFPDRAAFESRLRSSVGPQFGHLKEWRKNNPKYWHEKVELSTVDLL